MTAGRSDYDSPWKEALERYFPSFMALGFPTAHAGIDWTRGYEFRLFGNSCGRVKINHGFHGLARKKSKKSV